MRAAGGSRARGRRAGRACRRRSSRVSRSRCCRPRHVLQTRRRGSKRTSWRPQTRHVFRSANAGVDTDPCSDCSVASWGNVERERTVSAALPFSCVSMSSETRASTSRLTIASSRPRRSVTAVRTSSSSCMGRSVPLPAPRRHAIASAGPDLPQPIGSQCPAPALPRLAKRTAIRQCQVAKKANPYSGSRVLDTDLGVPGPPVLRLPCRAKEVSQQRLAA